MTNQSTTTKEALEPCWCFRGIKSLSIKSNIDHGDFGCRERGRYVYCSNCWAHGPTFTNDEKAVEGWNRSRIPAPSVAPPNRALVQLLNAALLHPESAEGNIRQVIEALSVPPIVAPEVDGISLAALLSVLERLKSKTRNPDAEWYHGWNAAIQCLINDINGRRRTAPASPVAPQPASCGFCGKSNQEVKALIQAPVAYICENCVAICASIIEKNVTPVAPVEQSDEVIEREIAHASGLSNRGRFEEAFNVLANALRSFGSRGTLRPVAPAQLPNAPDVNPDRKCWASVEIATCINPRTCDDLGCQLFTGETTPVSPAALRDEAEQCPATCADFSMYLCGDAHRCVLDAGHPFDPFHGDGVHQFETHSTIVKPRRLSAPSTLAQAAAEECEALITCLLSDEEKESTRQKFTAIIERCFSGGEKR